MDDELDFLEGAMGSWLEPGNADGQHDIAAYVVSKSQPGGKGGAPTRLPPINAPAHNRPGAQNIRSKKVYGYQEPKPVARRYKPNANQAPQLDRCKEDGGWSNRPSQGIPQYDWRNDRHLKKIQKQRESPPRKVQTAGQPFRRPVGFGMAQHAVPKKRTSQPLTKNAMQANNLYAKKPATTGSRTRLPPIKPSTKPKATRSRSSPARSAPATGGRKGASSAPVAEASPMDFFTKLKTVQNDNELLLTQLAEERHVRARLQERITEGKETLTELKDTIEQTKETMKSLEKIVRTSSKRETERNKWQTKLSQKDAQLRDLRKMHNIASKRLKKLEDEADRAARSGELNNKGIGGSSGYDSSYATQKDSIRALVKQSGDAKKRYEHLAVRKKELVGELNAALAANRTKQAAQAQIVKDREREKASAMKELERRLTQELQQQINRMRENHQRALRHREREHQQKMQEQRQTIEAMKSRLNDASRGSNVQTGELSQLQSQAAEQRKMLNDHQQRLDATKNELNSATQKKAALQESVSSERAVIAGLVREATKVDEAPQEGLAPMKAKHEKMRKDMQLDLNAKQKKQTELLHAVAKLESEAQLFNSKFPSDGAASIESEVQALEAELEALQHKIDAHSTTQTSVKKELDAAKKELKADEQKDSIIEKHTCAIAAAQRELQAAERQNTALLERLDLAERMVSMNSLN